MILNGMNKMTRKEAIQVIRVEIEPLSYRQAEALDMAIEALSADAVHGEWQRVDEQPYFRKHYYKVCCSVCHKQGSEKYNYCPNCGARMYKGGDTK